MRKYHGHPKCADVVKGFKKIFLQMEQWMYPQLFDESDSKAQGTTDYLSDKHPAIWQSKSYIDQLVTFHLLLELFRR